MTDNSETTEFVILDSIIKASGTTPEQCIDWKLLDACTNRFDFYSIRHGDPFDRMRFREIRHLHLLGNIHPSHPPQKEEHVPGLYLSDTWEWAVWVGCTSQNIQHFLEEDLRNLEKLTIRFTDLEEFNLETNSILFSNQNKNDYHLPHIVPLVNLKRLSLERNRRLKRIIGLDQLEQLESLNIQYTAVRSLQLFYPLENLTELYANNTPLESAVFLEFLPNLQALWLNHTCITELPPLTGMYELRKLTLTGTPITELDNCHIPGCLKSLYLKDMPLRRLPDAIGRLYNLRRLVLTNLKLEEFPLWLIDLNLPFSRDPNGGGIRLYNTTIEGVDMSIFDQSQETIREWFREYARKKQKKQVFISHSHLGIDFGNTYQSIIDRLERSRRETAEKLVQLIIDSDPWNSRKLPEYSEPRFGFEPFDFGKYYYPDNFPEKFSPLPVEEKSPIRWVCGRYTPSGCFDNEDWNPKTYLPAWKARKPIYLEDVPEGTPEEEPEAEETAKPLNELKVVFLGDGGAGKSHTIARLIKDGGQTDDFPNISTPGIVIQDKLYPYDDKEVKVHFWDFGGQEILHSMHRMFLTKRTLYVVMLNVRDGTQDDRARYWLYNLRSFAKDAPVLLVLNQMDMNENATLNESDLRKLYPALASEVVKLSTLKDTDADFEKKFIDVLRRQIGGMEILDFPFIPAWSRLKEKLQDMEKPYIFGDDFQKICDDCGVTDSDNIRRDLLNWFSDLGVSFCYSGSASLEDYVVLRPDWITNAIYIVLFNKAETAQNGQVSHEVIYKMLSSRDMEKYRRTVTEATYKSHEVDYVLKVFRKFRLSFLAEDGIEFIPMLCKANANPISAEYENDPDALEFRMHYEYLPNNVIHRLMVDRRRELNLDTVWLYGGQFRNRCTGLSAVVKTEGNLLRIMVRREDSQCQPQLYLNDLKQDIQRISEEMGLTIGSTEVAYKHADSTEYFDYESLHAFLDAGLPAVASLITKKPVLIQEILKQSGHGAQTARHEFIRHLTAACIKLQSNHVNWNASEDERTTYLRDILPNSYIILDQHLTGTGAKGCRAGELDLDIRLESDLPWTGIEALNLTGAQLSSWNSHLDKLLINYNHEGRGFLFLVSYVTMEETEKFSSVCAKFRDHARNYYPPNIAVLSSEPFSLAFENHDEPGNIHAVKCVYDSDGQPVTVYHLFVRMGR